MFKLMGVTNVLLKPVNNLPEFDVSSFPTSPATPAKIWAGAQELLRTILTPDIFNLWFAQLKAVACDSESITLEVANDFCELWLKDNYLGLIQDALAHASGKQLKVNFKVASHTLAAKNSKVSVANVEANGEGALEEIGEETPRSSARGVREIKETREVRELPQSKDTHQFNPKNTFDNFVVGSNNSFAHAAAMAVAQAPGKSYNPLFLYGGVGLGKTHLLHAIGHYVTDHKKGAKVAYVSSEKFTNEYIDAIQNNALVRFRKKYRQTDVLLIDDIQFLAGKERIQEEFFHTFNALHEAHKQIVLTCDRLASELQNLEHRLV